MSTQTEAQTTATPKPARRGRRIAVLIAGNLAVLVGLLLALELIGRVCVWIWEIPTEFRSAPFRGFGQTDPVLWWTLQPNLDTRAQDVRVRTNASGFRDERAGIPPGKIAVYSLGDSTTYGWRVEPGEMYTARVEAALGGDAAVVSTGVPGYTSYQCLMQLRDRVLPLKPAIVTILASNNECRAREIGDRERGRRLARQRALQEYLGFSHFWILVSRAPQAVRQSFDEEFSRGRPANTRKEYQENLREMIRLARAAGCRVIVMSLPMRLQFHPDWKVEDPRIPEVRELIRRADAESDPARRRPLLEEAIRLEPNQFPAHWRLAQALLSEGRIAKARQAFRAARDGDLHPEATKPSYNSVVKALCAEESVPFVDLDAAFEASGLTESQLFVDHCHPTVAGQQLIADCLAPAVKREIEALGR